MQNVPAALHPGAGVPTGRAETGHTEDRGGGLTRDRLGSGRGRGTPGCPGAGGGGRDPPQSLEGAALGTVTVF